MLSIKKAETKKQYSLEAARQIGKEIGIDWDTIDFSVQQFAMGLVVENYEHGSALAPETNVTNDSDQIAGKIAWAHLKELTDYYTRLKEMEE